MQSIRCSLLLPGMLNHSNFTVVPAPVPRFLLVLVPVPVPAQRSKRKQIQLAYDCRLDVSQEGRTLCTNWLHTGADLIQGVVSYVMGLLTINLNLIVNF